MARATVGTALVAALVGCGSEAPQGPLSQQSESATPSPSSTPSGSATASPSGTAGSSLPAFRPPTRGAAMHLTQPPPASNTKEGAVAFAVYHESITADGFEPPVPDLLKETSTPACEACAAQIDYARGLVEDGKKLLPEGDSTYGGLVDVVRNGQDWQVVFEYALHGGRVVDAKGATVQTFEPAKFANTLTALTWKDGKFVVTRTSTDLKDSTQIGPRR